MNKQIVGILIVTLVLCGVTFQMSYAYFSDQSVSSNNTFTAADVFPTTVPLPDAFADEVASVSGTFGHCCDAGNLSSDPAVAKPLVVGAPDSPPDADFIQISEGSAITLQFTDNKAIPGSGADIRIHTYDGIFPSNAKIEVSQDGITFFQVSASSVDTADVDVDIESSGLTQVFYVRITDLVTPDEEFPTLGFDLDSVEALNNSAL